MAVNKVIYGTTVLVDLTEDTVTASTLMQGYTAHDKSGAPIVGTATSSITVESLSVTANGTYAAPTGKAYSPVTVNVSGGGSDADFANTVMRSGAITSIPSSVTRIGTYAFYNCSNLALTELPSGVTEIDQNAFRGCTNLALTKLPSGVTRIGSYAFYNCSNLALTELSSDLTDIGTYAFQNCSNLALTALPSGVTSIYGNVFYNCSNLTQMDLPNVVDIRSNAFYGCSKLRTLVLRKSNAICTLMNMNAFTNTPLRGYNSLTGTVYVPQALIESYKTATNWSTLYNNGTVTFAAIEGSQYERE